MHEMLFSASTIVFDWHLSFLQICSEKLRLNSGKVQLALHTMPVSEYTGTRGSSQLGGEHDG